MQKSTESSLLSEPADLATGSTGPPSTQLVASVEEDTDIRAFLSDDNAVIQFDQLADPLLNGHHAHPKTKKERRRQRYRALEGALLCTASTACFAGSSLFVKIEAEKGFGAAELLFVRCLLQFAFTGSSCYFLRVGFCPAGTSRAVKWGVLARGLVDCVGLALFYFGITQLQLAYATVLFFTAPVWAGLIGKFWLNEPYGLIDFIGSLGSIIGVLMASWGSLHFDRVTPIQLLSAALVLLGAVFQGATCCIIRKVGSDAHFMQMVNSFSLSGLLLSPFLTILPGQGWVNPATQGWDCWLNLFLIAAFATAAGILVNIGAQLVKASVAVVCRSLDVVFALILQVIFLHVVPDTVAIVGCCVLFLSVAVSAIKAHHDVLRRGSIVSILHSPSVISACPSTFGSAFTTPRAT